MTIYSASYWRDNSELMMVCRDLGFIQGTVLDMTYGRGTWWKHWKPDDFLSNDLDPRSKTDLHEDFRALSLPAKSFGTIAFDPPYVSKGGRKTSGIEDFDDRYGLGDAPRTPAELQLQVNDGLTEARRLIAPGGCVLVKIMNYVSSGKLWPGTYETYGHARQLGFRLRDELLHLGRGRPQPKRTRKDGKLVCQKHARHTTSTLLVLEAPRR